MLLLTIVEDQYYVYGGINYKKNLQVFYINSFSTEDRDSIHILYNIIQFLSNTRTDTKNGWPEYGPVQNSIFVENDVVPISPGKQIFSCKGKVFKFSFSYGTEAHKAIEMFAPTLFSVQKINGEFMIEMEYLKDYEVLTKKIFKKLTEQQRCFVICKLISAIQMLH